MIKQLWPNSKKNRDKNKFDQTQKQNCDQTKKKHHENREKLPWEFVGCQGGQDKKKIVTKLKNSICEEKKPINSNCDKTQKL